MDQATNCLNLVTERHKMMKPILKLRDTMASKRRSENMNKLSTSLIPQIALINLLGKQPKPLKVDSLSPNSINLANSIAI